MNNKVTVNIFGQEYTISGSESSEKILHVAAWVDQKMREIDNAVGNQLSVSALAVLSSVNIANEYFETKKEISDLSRLAQNKEEDAKRYMQLWEETKRNFQDYQKEAGDFKKEKEKLISMISEKEEKIQELLKGQGNLKQEIEEGTEKKLRDSREKYKELENNFFDLQMENIKIKSELEKLRGGSR